MPIHDLALQSLDAIIGRAKENARSNDSFWETETLSDVAEPSENFRTARLSSLARQLSKAEDRLKEVLPKNQYEFYIKREGSDLSEEQELGEEELEYSEIQLMGFLRAIDASDEKLNAYRECKKLRDRIFNVETQIRNEKMMRLQQQSMAQPVEQFEQIATEWPDSVEDNIIAAMVSYLIERAVQQWLSDRPKVDAPVQCEVAVNTNFLESGKLVLECRGDFGIARLGEPQQGIDWEAVRNNLVAMKAEIEDPSGWKMMPTGRRNIWQKVGHKNDPQISIIEHFLMADRCDPSGWDNWVPNNSCRPRHITSFMCNSKGQDPDPQRILDDQRGHPITPSAQMSEDGGLKDLFFPDSRKKKKRRYIDNYEHQRISIAEGWAHKYLVEMLGIKGLDIDPPDKTAAPTLNR